MKRSKFKPLLSALAVVTLLSGCAQRGVYQWGGYDAMLYQAYKSPEKSANLRIGLEAHIEKMEQARQKVAPGLYAELGTLYLQAGDSQKAVSMYTKERMTWPESKGLMDALIGNVGRKSQPTNQSPAADTKS